MRSNKYSMMASIFVLAICMSIKVAFADTAGDLARCVQNQLTDLGFDAGAVDGVIGPQTRRAARKLRDEHPLRTLVADLPGLNRHTAVSWCRDLPRLSREAGQHRPFLEPLIFAVTDAYGPEPRALLERSLNRATNFYRSRYGMQIVSRLDFAGADSAKTILALAEALPSHTERKQKAISKWATTACGRSDVVQGLAFSNALLFCWPPQSVYDADWAERLAPKLQRTMMHELMHVLQRELAQEAVPQRRRASDISNIGPDWLVEGAAEVIADLFFESYRKIPIREDFRFRTEKVTLLAALQGYGSVPRNDAYGVANLATLMLARRHGTAALFVYWQRIGQTGSFETAFEQTFGLPIRAYETLFEKMRSDFAQMKAYANGEGLND